MKKTYTITLCFGALLGNIQCFRGLCSRFPNLYLAYRMSTAGTLWSSLASNCSSLHEVINCISHFFFYHSCVLTCITLLLVTTACYSMSHLYYHSCMLLYIILLVLSALITREVKSTVFRYRLRISLRVDSTVSKYEITMSKYVSYV